MSSIAWSEAMQRANARFYADHAAEDAFRTSMSASPVMAEALLGLIEHLDAALGHPPMVDVVDIGSGNGALLNALLAQADAPGRSSAEKPSLAGRLHLHGLDLRARPSTLDERIRWTQGEAPATVPHAITGIVIAHEWLDDLPVEVIGVDASGHRSCTLVDPLDGSERAAPVPRDDPDAGWADLWWPASARVESGRLRDRAWAEVASRAEAGLLLAIDYGHRRDDRPAESTLRGFAQGNVLAPVPDGSMNITAEVALDACRAAARAVLEQFGRTGTDVMATQEHALALLLAGRDRASTTPDERLRALGRHGQLAELSDPQGLGAHLWLLQTVGLPLPESWG